jgi:hypothetical protein
VLRHPGLVLSLVALYALLTGCQSGTTIITPASATHPADAVSAATTPPIAPLTPPTNLVPAQQSSQSPAMVSVWIDPDLPAEFRAGLTLSVEIILAAAPETASFVISIGEGQIISSWIYALVAPFPTIPDGVSFAELRSAWSGDPGGSFEGLPLLLDESTLGVFSYLWGEPAHGAVLTLPTDELLTYAWENRPIWALLPFEQLQPRWKVLEVDGISPIQRGFDLTTYPLSVPFSIQHMDGSQDSPSPFAAFLATNRDPARLTTLNMTGVTALVRATAETMRRHGVLHPAQDIGDWLRDADLTHISNEVPFTPDCPLPNPRQEDLIFCSNPAYIELLEYLETDIVELTGDHFNDYGPEAMLYTLDLYVEKSIPFYGGGYNEAEARQPLIIEHNGNRLAFLGCNAKGGGYATARGDAPGAVECDFDDLEAELARLKREGYIPIVTFQHFEYYTYDPQPNLIADFRRVAEAGAAIVSGSQAHQPHGFEFHSSALLHYGLGNLFFDQYHFGLPTGHAFIDRHVFYDGRHISTELLGIRFIDFARSRPVTPEEREELLRVTFDASLW